MESIWQDKNTSLFWTDLEQSISLALNRYARSLVNLQALLENNHVDSTSLMHESVAMDRASEQLNRVLKILQKRMDDARQNGITKDPLDRYRQMADELVQKSTVIKQHLTEKMQQIETQLKGPRNFAAKKCIFREITPSYIDLHL